MTPSSARISASPPSTPLRLAIAWTVALLAVLAALNGSTASAAAAEDDPLPERVTFRSADGKTELIGYLYRPDKADGKHPAIVMMPGAGGAYSNRADGTYDASTLAARYRAWGRSWADAGYIAVVVDGFGPRGFWQGVAGISHAERPATISEVTARPFDAYGALAFLRGRDDVIADRIGLMGWSNGGAATIATMSSDAPGAKASTAETGFRAALALYPTCKLGGKFDETPFHPYAPMLILHGTGDKVASYKRCMSLVEDSREAGGDIDIETFEDATHGFDTPTRSRQSLEANRRATEAAHEIAAEFFARHLKRESATQR